jgi:hypothetical protein
MKIPLVPPEMFRERRSVAKDKFAPGVVSMTIANVQHGESLLVF